MKNILLTGAAGFIGSHLTELLVNEGYTVKVLIRYNSKNNWGWLEESPIKNDIQIVTGDVRDYDCVFDAMKGCDTVFHLAALIGIPYSYVSPLAYIRTNVEGTYNVLQAARDLKLSNVIVTSTSETYGSAQYIPIDEKHPLVGQSPYSATKISADHLAISYFRSFNLPVKIVRPFNTYGPRQSARAIIPTIITQILDGKEQIKLGSLTPTRDFTYVKDTALGFLEIAKSNLNGQATNIGMNMEISMGNLANLIAELMDSSVEIIADPDRIRPTKSEVNRLYCNNEKIIRETAWKPNYNLNSGLTESIEWFAEKMKYYKSDIYNI